MKLTNEQFALRSFGFGVFTFFLTIFWDVVTQSHWTVWCFSLVSMISNILAMLMINKEYPFTRFLLRKGCLHNVVVAEHTLDKDSQTWTGVAFFDEKWSVVVEEKSLEGSKTRIVEMLEDLVGHDNFTVRHNR